MYIYLYIYGSKTSKTGKILGVPRFLSKFEVYLDWGVSQGLPQIVYIDIADHSLDFFVIMYNWDTPSKLF